MAAYRHDLFWAQRYAFLNRRVMFQLLCDVFTRAVEPHVKRPVTYEAPILCHHNYVAEETHFGEEVIVTRKGAIRAGAGELGIIPGSMGTQSYVVRGLGNAESFQSASHGAGRRMSRGAAKRAYTVKDLADTDGGRLLPQGRRRARRDPGRLQADRPGDEEPGRPGRGGRRAETGALRKGVSGEVVH